MNVGSLHHAELDGFVFVAVLYWLFSAVGCFAAHKQRGRVARSEKNSTPAERDRRVETRLSA